MENNGLAFKRKNDSAMPGTDILMEKGRRNKDNSVSHGRDGGQEEMNRKSYIK